MEQFKRIFTDYEIGTQGTVRSLKFGKVKVLSPHPNKKGYLLVDLMIDGKPKKFPIHRLVATAFIPNPDNKLQVNHKNGIKTDNRVENLEWCTRSENVRHAFATGLNVAAQGEDRTDAKLTNEQARFIRDNPDNLTQSELGKMFGVSSSTVREIQLGKKYRNAGGVAREKIDTRIPDETRAEIKRLYSQGDISTRALAEKFGIGQTTVLRIIHEE